MENPDPLTDSEVAEIEALSQRPCYEHQDDLRFVREASEAIARLTADWRRMKKDNQRLRAMINDAINRCDGILDQLHASRAQPTEAGT